MLLRYILHQSYHVHCRLQQFDAFCDIQPHQHPLGFCHIFLFPIRFDRTFIVCSQNGSFGICDLMTSQHSLYYIYCSRVHRPRHTFVHLNVLGGWRARVSLAHRQFADLRIDSLTHRISHLRIVFGFTYTSMATNSHLTSVHNRYTQFSDPRIAVSL